MKKITRIWMVCLLALSAVAFTVVKNIFDQLDIAEEEAREYIFDNFKSSNLSFPSSAVIKNLALGKRAGAVKELGDYIRKYTNSPEFAAEYKTVREGARPKNPADKEAKLKARIEGLKHDIETTEKDMKGVTGDMKKLYESTLQMQKTELKALQDPKDPNHKMYLMDLSEGGEEGEKNYKEDLKYFEQEYPAQVKDLVKRRLQEFLTLTADINFDAKLVDRDGRKRFADPKLEAKDESWKRCFRSGRETIAAARSYAQQWLKELN
ncbi:hypothetical protein D3H65_29650 [Paraflavitalea soli]|uniref:DUF3826 domain-containing protein n=1 Tax=Paraflavitalea soli TaxID=2315862 RepID=A0A3B7MTQ9_9BACT|nr:hypothetical protein [Paraflavitalea soli]AXY77902.1 hypothetical protein D3H65_29650 [Paraflavitalea soli]